MLTGKTFIVFGVSRLGIRIILGLLQQNADVTCMTLPEDDRSLVAQIPPHVKQIKTNHKDLAADDLQNVRCCVATQEVSPDIPVVLRAYSVSSLSAPTIARSADLLERFAKL